MFLHQPRCLRIAPGTDVTIPEKTLHAFADHGRLQGVIPVDGGDADAILLQITRAGLDIGTEDIYKIYAESFQGEAHLQLLLAEAQRIVDAAIEPKE
jgi:phosphoglucomutase